MITPKELDIDNLRKEFSERFSMLIGHEEKEKNLEKFSEETGLSLRQISQWRNPRHINWPSIHNLLRIMLYARISANWLLLGIGPKLLDDELRDLLAKAGNITDKQQEQILKELRRRDETATSVGHREVVNEVVPGGRKAPRKRTRYPH